MDPFEQQDVVIEPPRCPVDSSRNDDHSAEPMVVAEQPAETAMQDVAMPQPLSENMQTDDLTTLLDMLIKPQGKFLETLLFI